MDFTLIYFFLFLILLIFVINFIFSWYYKKKQDSLIRALSAFETLIFNEVEVTVFVSSKISSKSSNFFADVIFSNEMIFILQNSKLKLKGRIFQLTFDKKFKQYPQSTYTVLIESKRITNKCIVLKGRAYENSEMQIEITLDFLKRENDLEILKENMFKEKIVN